jgi:hypothetical protein
VRRTVVASAKRRDVGLELMKHDEIDVGRLLLLHERLLLCDEWFLLPGMLLSVRNERGASVAECEPERESGE